MNGKAELFLQDLKFAFRSLARAKGLAITVVLTLALGIGANANFRSWRNNSALPFIVPPLENPCAPARSPTRKLSQA